MTDKRTITVSATINLGNYENLRIEVSDLAESAEEADALRHFLASVLDGYGNNSASARAAIQKYKEHILENGSEASAETSEPDTYSNPFFMPEDEGVSSYFPDADTESDAVDAGSDTGSDTGLWKNAVPEEKPVQKPDFIPSPVIPEPVSVPNPAPAPVPKPESESYNLPPAPFVEEKNTDEYICSKCGARVNKLQRDVSMLFNHKILCKDCMK